MKDSLEQAAVSFQLSPGLSLMSALRELQAIRNRSRFPARFQLMQYIERQAHVQETQTTYAVKGPVSDKLYIFPRLATVENISDLPKETLNGCVDWLAEKAMSLDTARARDKGYYTRVFRALIEKNCWMRYRESDQRYLNRLFNRHYAYEMGHCLGFTLEQMQGFISRVLPDEIYINKDAEDLIEAWAFSHGVIAADAKRLLELYGETTAEAGAYDVIDEGGTLQLYEEAASFDGTEQQFLEWLLERRPLLEGRSRTAFSIYRNLLICAYLMMRALYDVSISSKGALRRGYEGQSIPAERVRAGTLSSL